MLERSAATLALAVALALIASATTHADPAPAYYSTLDACLVAMSKYKTGPAQCTYIDAIGGYELRVPGG
ncbi:hypothetical protein ACIA8C_00180 [Nocardia sp. NPDC051321]|uniref:hypothetical protein n=1 Tax=Nocardia sp. NPDC051321 TaxID=3364323 RepID=UPI00379C0A4B